MALGGQQQGTDRDRTWVPWVRVRGRWRLCTEVWSPAVLSVSVLCTCFVLSSVVIRNSSVYSSIGKRLSKLWNHQKYLDMACRREEEGESWSCCPSTWRLFEASCYFISTTVQSWNQSQQTCAAWQAELAVIRTSEEQDFITQSLEGSSAYYIGLSDPEGHRRWQWVDQTPYNASATFWHPGEPNGLEECCVELSFRGATGSWGWNDVSCQLPRGSCAGCRGSAYEGAACAAPTDSWLRPCELGAVPVPFPAPQG